MKDLIVRTLKGHIYKTWSEAFAALCQWCNEADVSLRFTYDPGWRVSADGGNPYLNESERGFTVEVNSCSFQNNDGGQAIYSKPSFAVHDGLRLLLNAVGEDEIDLLP